MRRTKDFSRKPSACLYCGSDVQTMHRFGCNRPVTCEFCGTTYHANEQHSPACVATAPARPPAPSKEPPAENPPAGPARRLLTGLTSEQRKEYPITTGFLDYFPDATAMVAHVSYKGNQKHNPGQALHWARGKSMDHEDCMARHTIERDTIEDEVYHAANRAWRAMAALQELLEKTHDLSPPRGTIPPAVKKD